MAKIPRDNRISIVKCYRCGSIYVSYKWEDMKLEPCPVCGSRFNDTDNVIPMWKVVILRILGRI